MDFTREPIIETVITPREGYRLVVRSSKGAGSEEHFVDALEVVSFGSGLFFRSLERPKPFLVPVVDYEVLEVREPRMVLKTPVEAREKAQKQQQQPQKVQLEPQRQQEAAPAAEPQEKPQQEGRSDRNERRRDRRRGFRRRRGGKDEAAAPTDEQPEQEAPVAEGESKVPTSTPMLSSILPPPTKLIRDDLKRLREDYKGAFYTNEDDDASLGSQEEIAFRVSDDDIRMSEGADVEVPQQEGSFREEANTSSVQENQ